MHRARQPAYRRTSVGLLTPRKRCLQVKIQPDGTARYSLRGGQDGALALQGGDSKLSPRNTAPSQQQVRGSSKADPAQQHVAGIRALSKGALFQNQTAAPSQREKNGQVARDTALLLQLPATSSSDFVFAGRDQNVVWKWRGAIGRVLRNRREKGGGETKLS